MKDPPGYEKMSEILPDFASPLLELAEDEDQYRRALTIAVVAWNLACLPAERRTNELGERLEKAVGKHGASAVQNLVERKLAMYPDIQRPIVDFELVDRGNRNYRLSVISSCDGPIPEPAAANP